MAKIIRTFSFCLLLALSWAAENKKDSMKRKGKLFSVFTIVQFQNSPCTTTTTLTGSTNNRNGTCYSATDCGSKGGSAQGSCAAGPGTCSIVRVPKRCSNGAPEKADTAMNTNGRGSPRPRASKDKEECVWVCRLCPDASVFGVCCLFIVTSGTISENCTYIQNANFPAAATAGATYTVNKCSGDVCYLRLDFETFSLVGVGGSAQPLEGVCLDMFTVTSPSSQNVPTICGLNTGDHIYVDLGTGSSGSATLTFNLGAAATTVTRQWDIKVTQVECSNPSSPPQGCLQYETGLTGRITSFNYNMVNDNHLNNQRYSTCIRLAEGFCCVQFMVCGNEPNGFTLDISQAIAGQDDACTSNSGSIDYISIPGASSTGNCDPASTGAPTQSRFCGAFFSTDPAAVANTPVCDCTPPIRVDFYTDNTDDGTTISKGVCLEYMQVAC